MVMVLVLLLSGDMVRRDWGLGTGRGLGSRVITVVPKAPNSWSMMGREAT